MKAEILTLNTPPMQRKGLAPDVSRFLQCMTSCSLYDNNIEKRDYLFNRVEGGDLSLEEADLIAKALRVPLWRLG